MAPYPTLTLGDLDLTDVDGSAKPNQHRAAAQSRWAAAHGQGA